LTKLKKEHVCHESDGQTRKFCNFSVILMTVMWSELLVGLMTRSALISFGLSLVELQS